MSPNINDDPQINSYRFQDSTDFVIVNVCVNGAIEQKDFEIFTDTDSLEVSTPAGDKWSFQLYEHVYSDKTEVKAEINKEKTQTNLEFRLYKQQTNTKWPQLHRIQSTPITPQQSDLSNDCNDQPMEQEHYDLSFKKVRTEFMETQFGTILVYIYISQVKNCNIEFTETNFTVIFTTDDQEFLQAQSIPTNKSIKLLIRVKERIKHDDCAFWIQADHIQIKLVKENLNGIRWDRLEPDEHTHCHQIMDSSSSLLSRSNLKTLTYNSHIGTSPTSYSNTSLNRSTLLSKDDTYMSSLSPPPAIGFTGIYNPANSCFMNAAIQCLSNTRELRDYFLKSCHTVEINRVNPLGMNGAMAEEFCRVIQELWSGKYSYINANQIRDYAAKRHQEFVGNGQHDAQELLTILLDAIHEDLNRVLNKPLVPPIEDVNRPDEVVADEYWRGYLKRNDSIIVQLFTGQFKSKTKCPLCEKESVTFDPFTSISVPLPKYGSVDVIVTFRNEEKSPTKYRITMSSDGSIADLKRRLSNKCGLPVPKMLAFKIQNHHSIKLLNDEDRVTTNHFSYSSCFDVTYITEVLTSAECNNEKIYFIKFYQRVFRVCDYVSSCDYCHAPPKPNGSPVCCDICYRVSYCDQECLKLHESDHKEYCDIRVSDNYETVGLPFIISLPESKVTYKDVYQQINLYAKHTVDFQIQDPKENRRVPLYYDDYDQDSSDDEDSFSDIENTDWITIKNRLSTSDSWSIVRIGDYFVKKCQNKSNSKQQDVDEGEPMVATAEDFEMLEDVWISKPLFRIMPQTEKQSNATCQAIIEPNDEADKILRSHTNFSIDWFTDNKMQSAFRVTSSKDRSEINNLVIDESVSADASKDDDVTLQQCLQLFIEPEILGPDDKWYCPHCKDHIQAEKKMSIWRLPPILILHLKRFKYDHCSSFGYLSSSREKIDTTIKFPIHDLNMASYCSSVSEESKQYENSSQYRYDLYGVINHRGSAWFGHYTSYARLLSFNDSAKTEIGWRLFDDQHVSTLSNVKDVVRSDAYVLFYRHRNLSVQFPLEEQLQQVATESKMT